jgi:hypothetical protein
MWQQGQQTPPACGLQQTAPAGTGTAGDACKHTDWSAIPPGRTDTGRYHRTATFNRRFFLKKLQAHLHISSRTWPNYPTVLGPSSSDSVQHTPSSNKCRMCHWAVTATNPRRPSTPTSQSHSHSTEAAELKRIAAYAASPVAISPPPAVSHHEAVMHSCSPKGHTVRGPAQPQAAGQPLGTSVPRAAGAGSGQSPAPAAAHVNPVGPVVERQRSRAGGQGRAGGCW